MPLSLGLGLGIGETVLPQSGGGPSYTGPLDLVPGAALAYSQRALSAAKLGTALYTIRRDSDDTTQSFSSDAATGDAPVSGISSFIGAGNGFITVWNDQSTSAANASQSTASQQPGWAASIINARPGLIFVKAQNRILTTSANVTLPGGAYTIFAVALLPTPTLTGHNPNSLFGINNDQFAGDGANIDFSYNTEVSGKMLIWVDASSDGDGATEAGGKTALFDQSSFVGQVHIVDSAWTFGSNTCFIDGAAISADSSFDAGPVGDITGHQAAMGAGDVLPVAQFHYDGNILEFLIYPSVLSAGDRLAVRQNIAAYYGITLP